MAWGDDDDEEEALPARTETAVNEKGFKTVVEWSRNAAEQKVKTTKEIFVKVVETRESKAVQGRVQCLRQNRFGIAGQEKDDSNVTIVAHNDERVTLEEEGGEHDTQQNAAKASMNEFAKKQMYVNGVPRRLHAIDARRLQERSSWVVSGPNLSRFGPRRDPVSPESARNRPKNHPRHRKTESNSMDASRPLSNAQVAEAAAKIRRRGRGRVHAAW